MSNIAHLIASRLMGSGPRRHRLAGPAIRVATAAVALGMVVMTLAVAVGEGFKREVRNKIVGFGSHIQVTSLNLNSSFETSPITRSDSLMNAFSDVSGVRTVQPYVTKPGIIKTDGAFQGIALKGIDSRFDWSFMESVLVEGSTVSTPDSAKSYDIMLSESMATSLGLTIGDPVRMFFVKDGEIRARRFELCGTFNSHFEDFDQSLAYVDMRQLTQLNGWDEGQISGYEILLDDFEQMDDATAQIASIALGRTGNGDDEFLRVRHIRDMQPQIFGWLALLDKNIVVILALIIAVAGLNMVSGLLILILEHTNTIGILKSIGCSNGLLRNIFIRMALRIVGRGLVIGNAVGLALCLLQSYTHAIKLDPDNYYLDCVPILLSFGNIALLNIGTATISFLLLLGPSGLVARISPVKAIRFN